MRLTRLYKEFTESEKSGGLILIVCIVVSLLIANSAFQEEYHNLWKIPVAGYDLLFWINDGLMCIFFLLIGLELEREIYVGELKNLKKAMLPIAGALGGMIVPASLYLIFNFGTPTQSGSGIPMATDIAFALGILSLLGKRVPVSLKIFLTALAVIDDLGAIIVIAIFYTGSLSMLNLSIALSIFAILLILNRMKVYNLIPYLIGGVFMWHFMHYSGIHATITGVLLAFAIPFKDGSPKSQSFRLQHFLHKPVAYIIVPLFALANTSITIEGSFLEALSHHNSIGILTGLVIGKPLGITLFSFVAVMTGLCVLPPDINWKKIAGTGMLAGIGFTMSIFVTLLAFDDHETIEMSKLMVLTASFIAGIIGYSYMNYILKRKHPRKSPENNP